MLVYQVFNIFFLLDTILHFYVYDRRLFTYRPEYKFEICLQIGNAIFSTWYYFMKADSASTPAEIHRFDVPFICILMLRIGFLVKYLMMIRDCRIVIETGSRLATPFISMLFAYYLLTFEYLVIGTIMYGGDVLYSMGPEQANDLGSGLNIIWNFNDFSNAFMVLTLILVTNNWNDVVD